MEQKKFKGLINIKILSLLLISAMPKLEKKSLMETSPSNTVQGMPMGI